MVFSFSGSVLGDAEAKGSADDWRRFLFASRLEMAGRKVDVLLGMTDELADVSIDGELETTMGDAIGAIEGADAAEEMVEAKGSSKSPSITARFRDNGM